MFGFLKKFFNIEEKKVKTITDLFEKKSEEIETGEWIGHGIVSSEGLTIYSKVKNPYYKIERLFPYGVKIYDTVLKFHNKSNVSFKDNLFKKPEVVVYRTESMEEIFILKNKCLDFEIYLIWICDPAATSSNFSTDKMMTRLSFWLKSVSKELATILEKRKERNGT
ncbi:hypothetical protein [Desulfurobacterium indicum]|uniref:Uncharacterized protein n=1 Tax=Desulfurobacterium indicum TaxID=1914305 RepID=A0A1R1MNL9_9BACT|nr:hypothetical protein [Desulfurobacterium indicum]OMH41367.1 hypothetical protein BLW93_00315 [Desulfurobacterium indicum]